MMALLPPRHAIHQRRGHRERALAWARCVVFVVALVGVLGCRCDDRRSSGLEQDRELWNATYREKGRNFKPSAFLMEMVKGRKPGRALDIGMGQGRNAMYLASQGWQVTGVDISDEGIRQAREAALARKLSLETVLADIGSWDHGDEQWDLVLLIYMDDEVDKIRRSLKRGGILVSELFHVDSVPRIGTTPEEFAKRYADGFDVLRNEVVEEMTVWGKPAGGPDKVVHFAAQKR